MKLISKMNTARIDPLALLAFEADARARTEKCVALSTVMGNESGLSLMQKNQRVANLNSQHPSMAQIPYRFSTALASSSIGSAAPSMESTLNNEVARHLSPSPTAANIARAPKRREPNFATKLHAILADRNCKSIITWLPAGESFVILNR
jgi:hypothetical protein